jgi:hypothetical protein
MKRFPVLIFAVLFLNCACLMANGKVIYVKQVAPGDDATPFIVEAVEKCRQTKATKLVLEKGVYNCKSDLAPEKYVFTSNNDEGLKRFVFELSGMKDLEIDGQNSLLMLDGYVCPFLLSNTANINVRNIVIDYKRSFHSEGIIVASYKDSLDLSIPAAYPYDVQNNKLMFYGDKIISKDNAGDPKRVQYPFWHLLEFDAVKREPEQEAFDYLNVQNMVVKELKPGLIRIFFPRMKGKVGNTMVFNPTERLIPCFSISSSQDIKLTNVTMHHAGAMGVIAQRSKNITLDSVKVIPSQGRMISLAADATHFVNCSGKITMTNCLFEGQKDDATNIHGIYVKITSMPSPREAIVKLIHYQQFGFDFLTKGAKVEMVEATSLNTMQENEVISAERINKEYTKIRFKNPISSKIKIGDVIAALGSYPDVEIRNCTFHRNRARGLLLGSRGKILIENNYFHTHCAAINLEGDGRFWYEQSGVRDLTIRNNMFDNCNYSLMLGLGVIMTLSGIENDKRAESRYNRNILIENNTFKLATPNILNLYSVDNVTYRNNKVENSDMYKMTEWVKSQNFKRFIIKDSSNINIQE